MYSTGLLLMVCITVPLQGTQGSDWLHFPNRDEQIIIALVSTLGILTAHFLKRLGVIWREVSAGTILLAVVFLDLFDKRGSVPVTVVVASAAVFVGTVLCMSSKMPQK
jgi:hypothetical protein